MTEVFNVKKFKDVTVMGREHFLRSDGLLNHIHIENYFDYVFGWNCFQLEVSSEGSRMGELDFKLL